MQMLRENQQNFSDAGAAKLKEMSEKNTVYTDYLKFQGRVFKHSPRVALEFFAQKLAGDGRPDTGFIATAEQWDSAGYTIKPGGNSIHFVDEDGKHSNLFDFSQVTGDFPPPRWTLNVETAAQVKTKLGIPADHSLLKGVTSQMITNTQIVDCMAKLEIPPKSIEAFRKSYVSSVQTILAGRFEIGGGKFNIVPDATMFKELYKDGQAVDFLGHITETAKEILLEVEKLANEIVFKKQNNNERGGENDVSRMEQTDRGTASERARERVTNNPANGIKEQANVGEDDTQGRNALLGDSTGREPERDLPGIQAGNSVGESPVVQIRPDMGSLQHGRESGGMGEINRGRTDRNVWDGVDELDERTPQGKSADNADETHLSDSSEGGRQEGLGLSGTSRQPVRGAESATRGTGDGFRLRGHGEVGNDKSVLHGFGSDEGESADSGDAALNKINSVFAETETSVAFKESADVSSISEADLLKVGDIIGFDNSVWRIVKISDDDFDANLKNLDETANNGYKMLIGHWRKQLQEGGFTRISENSPIMESFKRTEDIGIPVTEEQKAQARREKRHRAKIDVNQGSLLDFEEAELPQTENVATLLPTPEAPSEPNAVPFPHYNKAKEQYPGYIVFNKLGDFYEMFEDDAEKASALFGFTLSNRAGIKMCGFPLHMIDEYAHALNEKGHKIVVAEGDDAVRLIVPEQPETSVNTDENIKEISQKEQLKTAASVIRSLYNAVNETTENGDVIIYEVCNQLERAKALLPDNQPSLKALITHASESDDFNTLKERMETLYTEFVQHYTDAPEAEKAKASEPLIPTLTKKPQQESVRITDEVIEFHNGQADSRITAFIGENRVGALHYSVYDETPHISMIEVEEDYRRQGVATSMIQHLAGKYPGIEIEFGMLTEDGAAFKEAVTYTAENEEYTNILNRVSEINDELDRYESLHSQSEVSSDVADKWNGLADEKYDLENRLADINPEKTVVKPQPPTEKELDEHLENIEKRLSKTTARKLYNQFAEMFPKIISGENTVMKFGKEGDAYEPLTVEHLAGDTYGFMTWYIQNGDLMRDPDLTFVLNKENRTLNILEYQQDGVYPVGTVYEQVYDDKGYADEKLLAALERNFAQVLKVAKNVNRPLTAVETAKGEVIAFGIQPQPVESTKEIDNVPEDEENNDARPELRKTLNDFSMKHGLGELNVDGRYLIEEMKNGDSFIIGEIGTAYEYDHTPITSEKLKAELINLETNFPDIPNQRDRREVIQRNGGITPLPKAQDNLPEIVYADNPSNRFWDNLAALKELKRIEEAISDRDEPYNKYHKKEDSDNKLSRYCGWGGLPQVFDRSNNNWSTQRDKLKDVLTPDEYEAARETTLNAHYTPQIIIDAMYSAIKNMDLPRNAQILEPSCGTGNFIRRLPAAFGDVEVTGVEIDDITARIATHLNPEANIFSRGFEDTHFKNNSFDLVIGNVPFGDYKLIDRDYTKDWLIHDAFFRKALDKVAPGGVVAFITSAGTLDKANPKVREYLATQAELVGAIRLPNNAFANAGTKVTADMIFLKKRETPLLAYEEKPDWCYTSPNADNLTINNYFVSNPHMVLGKMEQTTFFDRLTCTPFEGAKLDEQLNEAIKSLNAKITVTKREKAAKEREGVIPADMRVKNFTFSNLNDESNAGTIPKIYYRQGMEMTEVKLKDDEMLQLHYLCNLRTVARDLIDLQKTTATDDELAYRRTELNVLYDGYREKYGALNSPVMRKIFHNDADYPLLCGLEKQDKKTLEYSKADIFHRRTVNPQILILAADSIEEALQISLDRRGKPNIQYMAVLLSREPEDVCKELFQKGYAFRDPDKIIADVPYSGIVDKSEYLSGNVREKLKVAQTHMAGNPEYKRNIEALQRVIPEDIPAEDITFKMGAPWIDGSDYTRFLHHLSGRNSAYSRNCEVHYVPATGEFEVTNAGSKSDLNLNESTTYGTADYSMYQLADKILNQRRIAVKKEVPDPNDPDKTITKHDPKATKNALEKAEKIKKAFKEWIYSDEKLKAKYERKYNDLFNCLVGREYGGSHLTFPGMNSDFILREHQKNAIARASMGGNSLIAHVVGAGKSAVMFATVMRKKELGLISKACMVVPKALTEQIAKEWRHLYPDARILTVSNDDLATELKRNMFTARVATGSYDAVVLSQEQYEKIPMSREFRKQFMQKQLDVLEDSLRERKRDGKGKRDPTTKQLEAAKKRLVARIEKMTNPKSAAKGKDNLLEFEQLGFDYLVVDEAHCYKNGFVHSKMTNVSGVTTQPSGRAEDMQMKCDYFNTELGQGHIQMCTGTPVSNSMTELYVVTRYLRPDLLEQAGISRFDDWAATFGNVTTQLEYTAYNTMKLKTRFSQFTNLPELMAFYKEFADIKSAEKLNLPRPSLVSYDEDGNKTVGKNTIVSVPATPEQKAYVKELSERAEAINSGAVKPDVDNFLKITGEARLIGLGNGAVKSLYEKRGEPLPPDFVEENERNGKVDACVDRVHKIWADSHEDKGVQLVFSDVAVNDDDGKFSAYEYIKAELIQKGIPAEQIIFAPKADSKDREDIFQKINAGEYRIVIASTGTLGTGANIQERLKALHHCDIPWKPSDFEQREGRILRQGNLNKEVQIFNYVTEGTLDSYLYSTVTNKARFIAQILDNECPARVSEDMDAKVLTYAEIQAIAAGDDDVRDRIETANSLAELHMLKREHNLELSKIRSELQTLPAKINECRDRLEKVETDKIQADKIGDITITTPDGQHIYNNVNEYLYSQIKLAFENSKTKTSESASVEIGTIGGQGAASAFKVSVVVENAMINLMESSATEKQAHFLIKGVGEYSCDVGIGENANNVTRLKNFFEKAFTDRVESYSKRINDMTENLKQAEQQVNMPFERESEIEKLTKKLDELDEKLSGITAQNEETYDPEFEAEPLVETAAEKAEREAMYADTEDNDYQPIPDEDIQPPPNRRR